MMNFSSVLKFEVRKEHPRKMTMMLRNFFSRKKLMWHEFGTLRVRGLYCPI